MPHATLYSIVEALSSSHRLHHYLKQPHILPNSHKHHSCEHIYSNWGHYGVNQSHGLNHHRLHIKVKIIKADHRHYGSPVAQKEYKAKSTPAYCQHYRRIEHNNRNALPQKYKNACLGSYHIFISGTGCDSPFPTERGWVRQEINVFMSGLVG